MADQAGTFLPLGVFLLLPGWDASPSPDYPQHKFIHLSGERHCESQAGLAQKHNTTSPAKVLTHNSLLLSGVECSNCEVNAPP